MNAKHSRSNSLIFLLERTLRQCRKALQDELRAAGSGLSVDQWLLLQQVAVKTQHQHELAAMTAKDPASVTRMLNLLAKKKLITRSTDKNDKRSILVTATTAGKKVVSQCEIAVERFRKTAGKGLTQEELNLQKTVLDKLFENCGGK